MKSVEKIGSARNHHKALIVLEIVPKNLTPQHKTKTHGEVLSILMRATSSPPQFLPPRKKVSLQLMRRDLEAVKSWSHSLAARVYVTGVQKCIPSYAKSYISGSSYAEKIPKHCSNIHNKSYKLLTFCFFSRDKQINK